MPPSTPPRKPHIVVRGHPPALPSRLLHADRRTPHIGVLERRRVRRSRGLRLPLRILMLLAVAGAMIFAQSLLIPVVLAAFIALGLNPIVAGLNHL